MISTVIFLLRTLLLDSISNDDTFTCMQYFVRYIEYFCHDMDNSGPFLPKVIPVVVIMNTAHSTVNFTLLIVQFS